GRLTFVLAKRDPAALDRRRQQDAPAVFRHPDIAKFGPALGLDTDCGAQINLARLKPLGTTLLPPVERARMPAFQRPAEPRIGTQPDFVRDQPVIIDIERLGHVRAPSLAPQIIVISATAGPHGTQASIFPAAARAHGFRARPAAAPE